MIYGYMHVRPDGLAGARVDHMRRAYRTVALSSGDIFVGEYSKTFPIVFSSHYGDVVKGKLRPAKILLNWKPL